MNSIIRNIQLVAVIFILVGTVLAFGFEINLPFRSITLSAPITYESGCFLLILLAFNSAKFLEIISGEQN